MAPRKQKPIENMSYELYQSTRETIRLMLRTREDFQRIRISQDNRLGLLAEGGEQNVERNIAPEDREILMRVARDAEAQEDQLVKDFARVCRRMPVYPWLVSVKGVGDVAIGQILGSFDIYKADTVSKMWQYAGLNGNPVYGRISVPEKEWKPKEGYQVVARRQNRGEEFDLEIKTPIKIRGNKLTSGFLSPCNMALKTALLGVMAPCMIKCNSPYRLDVYDPRKARMQRSELPYHHTGSGENPEITLEKSWSEVSDGLRNRDAMKYMVKMFILDLYKVWRPLHGLSVRPPYQEEKLGHRHAA